MPTGRYRSKAARTLAVVVVSPVNRRIALFFCSDVSSRSADSNSAVSADCGVAAGVALDNDKTGSSEILLASVEMRSVSSALRRFDVWSCTHLTAPAMAAGTSVASAGHTTFASRFTLAEMFGICSVRSISCSYEKSLCETKGDWRKNHDRL